MHAIADELHGEMVSMEFPVDSMITVTHPSFRPGWFMNRVGKSCTFYYVCTGTVNFSFGGQTYICNENSLFYLEIDENARIYNPDPDKNCVIYCVTFQLKPGYKMEDFKIPRPLQDESGQLQQLLQQIYRTHVSEGVAYKIRRFYEFSRFFYEVITHWLHSGTPSQVNLKLSKAMEYIKLNYRKSITVEELSQVVGYSVSHLRRLFAENYGMSPQAYILHIKLRRAKQLLEEQEYTVAEIAERLGFSSASYFCKLFKAKTGTSPYQYQKQYARHQPPVF